LNIRLATLQEELESGSPHIEAICQYFEVRGMKVYAKEEAITEAKRNHGWFALLSNDIKDPIEALEICRNKDLVEKAFENLKERLNLRRLAVSSEQSLDGKLFV
jgi:transposase